MNCNCLHFINFRFDPDDTIKHEIDAVLIPHIGSDFITCEICSRFSSWFVTKIQSTQCLILIVNLKFHLFIIQCCFDLQVQIKIIDVLYTEIKIHFYLFLIIK